MKSKCKTILILVAFASLFGATLNAQNFKKDKTAPVHKSMPQKALNIAGTKWQPVFIEGAANTVYRGEKVPFIEFTSTDRVHGFAGNNTFNGTFKITPQGNINFGALMTTRMMGQNNNYEMAFLRALEESVGIQSKGDNLVMLNRAGHLVIEFKPLAEKEKPSKALNLANTKWQVVYLEGAKKPFKPMGDGRVPFIAFNDADKINGFAGDNIFNGGYRLERNGNLNIGDNLAVTMMMGANGEYEYAFLQALRKISKAEIKDAGMLCLFDKKGGLLMHLKPM